ncbi:MAG: hypothetical protein AB8B72_06875 [Crocinitomicaceae bacterium]
MRFIYLSFLIFHLQCTSEHGFDKYEFVPKTSKIQAQRELEVFEEGKLETTFNQPLEINCDSIYNGENIAVQLWTFESNYEFDRPNSEFVFLKNDEAIFRDSVFSFVRQIEFEDYNSDGVKDVLIQEYSDARSNWTYNLYLINTNNYMPEHIVEFSEIKNPNLNSTGDTIKSCVISDEIYSAEYLFDHSNRIIQIGETAIARDPK